jgi:hypothetical protein
MWHPNEALAPTRTRQRNTSSSNNKFWTQEEDRQLTALVNATMPPVAWGQIAEYFPTKTENQVSERWTTVLDPSLLKGSWTRAEDETIIRFVGDHGTKSWARLSAMLPGRIGKQCRERWFNALDPALNRGPWTSQEDRTLIELHQRFGNHWTKIGSLMPTRSQNAIKNRWNSSLAKRQDDSEETPAPTPIARPKRTPLPSIALLPMPGSVPTIGDVQSSTVGTDNRQCKAGGAHQMNLTSHQGIA